MLPNEFINRHQIELTPEEAALCDQAAVLMSHSVDPYHDSSHVHRMLDYLHEFIQTDEFRRIAHKVNLKIVFIAILWHDCWRAGKDAKYSVSLFWLTLYEGLGASRYFSKASHKAHIDSTSHAAIKYVIKKHSRFQLFPIKTVEAKILRLVDTLDMFNPDRTYLLKRKYFLERPITLSTYRAGKLGLRIFGKKNPKAIHDFEWAQKISDLRSMYVSHGYQVLEEYKTLCDLLRNQQFKEFERHLDGLRKKYLDGPEYMPGAVYAFESQTIENSF